MQELFLLIESKLYIIQGKYINKTTYIQIFQLPPSH